MAGISAASLLGIDWDRLRAFGPARAEAIAQLGAAMGRGSLTEEQLTRLCELLLEVGETIRAKELLVANAAEDGPAARLLRARFPELVLAFDQAVAALESQFAIRVEVAHRWRLLSADLVCHAASAPQGALAPVVTTPPIGPGWHVQLTLDMPEQIEAVVVSPGHERFDLRYEHGQFLPMDAS